MRDAGFLGVTRIGGVDIGQNDRAWRMFESKRTLHVLPLARVKKCEAHLVELTIDWPEVAGLHFAALLATVLDRRLIHGLDATGPDGAKLCLVYGLLGEDRL